MEQSQVIVIGAGVAGLCSAAALQKNGLKVIVLEARKRVGGRIHSIHDSACAEPAELGAEFVHGRSPQLGRLEDEGAIHIVEGEGDQFCFQAGELTQCDDTIASVSRLLARASLEQTFEELLRDSTLSTEARLRARAYVEGFNAADASRVSVKALAAQQQAEDDRIARIEGGYDAVPRALNHGLDVRLNTVVELVRWKRGEVEVSASGEVFKADCVVVTLPLGVLQAGSVRFDPQPSGIFNAASRLAVGHVVKLTMRFDHRLWMRHPQLATFSFVHAIDEAFPTWWTRGQMLTAWAGGRQVDRLRGMSRDELVSSAIDTFARISGIDSPRLMSELGAVHFHDWSVDPFSLGAYSYVPVGALEAVEALAQPVEETLYYAGEACGGAGMWGTVHGAMESGERCARAILDNRR